MKKVIVITGPTGSGKTRLSIEVAKLFGAEIINGDSVQVYKGLDIGSAKITTKEKKGVVHHLLGINSNIGSYSVYNFQKDARKLIDEIKVPLIVGGTGLYIKAALYDYEFREEKRDFAFEEKYSDYANEKIYELLLQYDPKIMIDAKNRRRLLRALEQALKGELRSKRQSKDVPLYDILIIYLDIDRTILETRLVKRLDEQIKAGFLDEVKELRNKRIEVNAIGYRELNKYLAGIYSLDEAKAEIVKVSKRFAKKQKTWFKNQTNSTIYNAISPTLNRDVANEIRRFLKRSS